MEVEPASIGRPAVRALSGSPPGEIAVEKVDLPGEETVATRLNRIPKVHIGLFLEPLRGPQGQTLAIGIPGTRKIQPVTRHHPAG